ncbi:MAG: hypothetical protein WBM48_03590 [Polyangiales bacterium]|jgi:ribonuclease HII
MLVMGVDENGLGPRLGPLVATSLTLETPRYARSALCERGLRLGLTDSKETGGFGRMGFTESVALALLAEGDACAPRSADRLLHRVFPEVQPRLKSCCPNASTAEQCWGIDLELPTFGGDEAFGRDLLERLVGRSRLRIVDVQSRIACAGVLNAKSVSGQNKLAVDLELFEDLIDSVHRHHGAPLLAVCGMVGGIRDYASRFGRFDADRVQQLKARKGQRRYAVEGVGELRFEVDADARHLPVALASIVGKYVREICMRRIGEFYRRGDPELQLASGYHDPVTTRFIRATELPRRKLGIAQDCFRRQA